MSYSPNEPVAAELIHFADSLADASRQLIRTRYRQKPLVEMKSDDTPVTATDRDVETAIRELIVRRYPGHGMIGEEHAASGRDAEWVWVVDPIDGTRSFVAGRPMFGTLIALTRNARPVLGVVDMPMLGERWIGASGHATTFNGENAQSRACAAFAGAILLTTSPEYLTGTAAASFANVAKEVQITIYDAGTQAYGLIASGLVDIVIAASYGIVDYLAAVPVIEGAGGAICDWDGRPLDLHSGDRFVAVGDASMLPATLQLLR